MATGTSRTVYYTPSGGSKTNVGSYHQSSTISIANAANCTITAKAVLRTSSGSTESTAGGTVSPTLTTLTNKNSVITWDINAVCTVLPSISAAKNYPFTGSISWTKAGTSQTAISYTGSTGSMNPGTSAVTKDIATKTATVAKTTSSQAISATISMNINTSGNYSGSGNSSVSLSGTVPAISDNSVTLVATPRSGSAFLGWATSATATTYVSTSTSYTVSDVTAGATYYGIFTNTRTVHFSSGINEEQRDSVEQICGDGTYRTITFPTAKTISGWTFIGWHCTTDATSSPTYSSNVTAAAPTTHDTFYAVYSRTLTITYANGGGTGTAPTNSTGTQYYNSYSSSNASTVAFTLRANTFTRSGYTFNGWDIGAASSSYSWAPAVDASATKTATAQWLQNITVTATNGNATYDGAAHKAKVSVNVAGATVEYGTSTSYEYSLTATNANTAYELSSVSATNVADSKTVYYRVSKSGCVTATGSTTITISKASVGAKPTTSVSKTYTGSSQSNGYTTPTGVSKSGNDSGTAVGTYTATYTPDGNHKWSDNTYAAVSVTLTIGQRTVTWSAPTANSSTLTYNGTAKTLASVGSATTGGTMYYYVSDSSTAPTFSTSTWKTTIDTQINAKTWYIYYRCYVSDTTNNTGTNINTTYSISKAINKADNPISFLGWSWTYSFTTSENTTTIREATNAQGTVSYSLQSQKQGSTTVNYFSFNASTKVLTVAASTPVNTYTLVFRATATGNDNYNSGTEDATVTVTINQASSSFTLNPTTLTLTYPTAGTSTFSGTNCSINGVSSSNTSVATVAKNGNTITVTPQAVGTATITVTGTAASTNYSAPANKTISVTVNRGTQTVNLSATSGTITYPATTLTFTASTTGNGALSVSPTSGNSVANASISNGTVTVTKAGYGTATITVTAAQTNQYNSASKTYSVTVAKAAGTLTLTAKTGLVYTGSSQTLTTYSGNSGTVTYDTTYVNSGTNAGTYTVKATSAESTNYYAVTKQVNVTISAANQAPTVTAVANLKYTGSAQTLATLGGTHPGTMHYRLGTGGSWSTTIPTATNAGSYTVYWYADAVANSASSTTNYTKATNNYNAYSSSSSPSSTACSIGKADNPMTWSSATYTSKWYASTFSITASAVSNAQGTVTYSLVSQVDSGNVTVTYFSFNTSTRVLSAAASVAPIEVYRITLRATAAGNDNYNSKTLDYVVQVTVSKSKVGAKPTTSVSKTYNGSEQTNGYTTPTGVTMSGNNKGTTVGTYTATYTPNYGYCWSDDTYDAVSVTLTINKRTVTPTAPTLTTGTLTYNGSSKTLANAGSCTAGGTMYYYVGTSSTAPTFSTSTYSTSISTKTDAGTYYIFWYCYVSDTTNNNDTTTDNINVVKSLGSRTIEKADISPTVSMSGWTYGGTASNPSVSGNSGGGSVTYEYKVSTAADSTYTTTKPSNAGTYTVRATIAATSNYNGGTATTNFTIAQANNPIAVTATQSISANYNISNQDKSFTAATGAQGTVTYAIQSQKNSGGTTVTSFSIPTNTTASLRVAALTTAGTYTVVVRATAAGNSNYKSGYKDITITVTVTSYTVTMTKGTGISAITYKLGTGNATTYSSAVTVPVGQTVTYGATASSGYTWWKWTGTHSSTTNAYSFTMPASNVADTANAMQQITTPSWKGTLTYSGSSQSATTTTLWNNYNTSTSTIGGTTSGTNAGSYNATFTPKSGYCWTDGTTSAKTVSWSITRASVGAKPATSVSKTYNGSEQNNGYTTPSGVNITGNNKGTNAGSYVAKYTPDSNHMWSDGTYGEVSVTLTIAAATMIVDEDGDDNDYNGQPHYAKIEVSVAGAVVEYGTSTSYGNTITITNADTWYTLPNVSRTDAGGTTIYYRVTCPNYVTVEDYLVLSVSKVYMTVTAASYTGAYDGSPHSASIKSNKSATTINYGLTNSYGQSLIATNADTNYTMANVNRTDEGTTTVYWQAVNSPNYYNRTGTTTITITKASISPSVSMAGWTYGGTASTPSVSGNPGGGSVTYHYKVQGAADSTYSTTKPTSAGNYTVRATVAETANYQGGTATANFTIAQREVTLTWGTTSWTYDGNTHSTTCTAGNLVSGDTCTVTLTGNSVGANVGSATVTASGLSNSNYKLPSANTKVISVVRKSVGAKPTTSVSKLYNMAEQTNNYTTPSNVTMTGNNKGTNVGTYSAIYTPNSNYCWSDNSYGAVTVTLTIWAPCVYVKQSDVWKQSIPIVKVNGAWKVPNAVYVKVNGAWKQVT